MNTVKSLDTLEIDKYLHMFKRRKYWAVIPFLAVILGGLGYLLHAPEVYEAQTMILVQTQSVPKELVRSIVTEGVEERLRTISQQVTSRTNLEAIIRNYGLVEDMDPALSVDAMVEEVRSKIKINVETTGGTRQNPGVPYAFTISFRGKDPEKVMQVTNALASNFISENLQVRETQVLGTSGFLGDELESVRRRLAEKEEELKAYRERNMGGLPEQLNPNLAMLQRLQTRMDQLSRELGDLENRKILLRQTLEEMRRAGQTVTLSTGQGGLQVQDLASLRSELTALEARYTSNHPDVVRLKKVIETLEALTPEEGTDSTTKLAGLSRAEQTIVLQLSGMDLDIAKRKEEIRQTQIELAMYHKRVEDTPKREQELFTIQRDYNNLKGLHESLVQRKLEADISASMEQKQKGEQFRVLDPAKKPNSPVEPNKRKILLLVVALGLGLGVGLAYLREMMDTSYKAPEEIENELDMNILVSIPYHRTGRELRYLKAKETLKAVSVGAGFVVCAGAIMITAIGLDGFFQKIKTLLGIA
jgi:polysaccharide chain length determinant protein (PEP-CTERM system associated)